MTSKDERMIKLDWFCSALSPFTKDSSEVWGIQKCPVTQAQKLFNVIKGILMSHYLLVLLTSHYLSGIFMFKALKYLSVEFLPLLAT